VPVLRIPNISEGIVDHDDLKYADLPTKEFQQLRLQSGDVLVIRSNGSVSLVGKSALVREAEKDFAYAGYLIRIRPDRTKVQPEYLNLVMGSYEVRLQIEVPARSTSGVNNINSEELRSLRFSLPPLPEQQEIVRRVESFFTLADQLEARYRTAKAHVDKLTQSILVKAFRGELVPQDPNDEPAAVLLERIREEREATPTVSRKRTLPEKVVSKAALRKSKPSQSPPKAVPKEMELSKTARRILRHMKLHKEYSKDDILVPLVLSTGEWNSAIRELKEAGAVVQTGDKRGARYRKVLQ
jgi:type I restriction enzyme S subunit